MTSVFRDPGVEPVTEVIHAALGPATDAWEQLTALIADSGGQLTWRYYRDGGWLAKATKGKKTIAWLCVAQGEATITLYFAERHRPMLADNPGLAEELRHRIETTVLRGRLLPVTLKLRGTRQLPQVRELIAAKLGTN